MSTNDKEGRIYLLKFAKDIFNNGEVKKRVTEAATPYQVTTEQNAMSVGVVVKVEKFVVDPKTRAKYKNMARKEFGLNRTNSSRRSKKEIAEFDAMARSPDN